jgi:Transcription factor WhiB
VSRLDVAGPLAAAVRGAVAAGTPPPCIGPLASFWTSDDPAARSDAAEQCSGCVIIGLCGDVAEARGERWGVWGGVDRGARP